MFERFTTRARETVIAAQEEAHSLGHRSVSDAHLLLALLHAGDDGVTTALARCGVAYPAAQREVAQVLGLDAEALRSLGIDLDAVRGRVEARFGAGALDEPAPTRRGGWLRRGRLASGHVPFTDDAKLALELSLRECLALRSRSIETAHLLLGLLRAAGPATAVLDRLGVDRAQLRRGLVDQLRRSA